jgi:hypothetical protein
MAELLDVVLSVDADSLSEHTNARNAAIALAAHLVSRQVSTALPLQERIRHML